MYFIVEYTILHYLARRRCCVTWEQCYMLCLFFTFFVYFV